MCKNVTINSGLREYANGDNSLPSPHGLGDIRPETHIRSHRTPRHDRLRPSGLFAARAGQQRSGQTRQKPQQAE